MSSVVITLALVVAAFIFGALLSPLFWRDKKRGRGSRNPLGGTWQHIERSVRTAAPAADCKDFSDAGARVVESGPRVVAIDPNGAELDDLLKDWQRREGEPDPRAGQWYHVYGWDGPAPLVPPLSPDGYRRFVLHDLVTGEATPMISFPPVIKKPARKKLAVKPAPRRKAASKR